MEKLIDRMCKTLVLTAALLFAAPGLSAQTKETIHELSSFKALDIASDFEVTVTKGNYSVKVSVDGVLSEYVKSYVKGHTLFLFLDEKLVPKDIKKLYKGRNGLTPIMRATVYTPELESINLSDQAIVTVPDEFAAGNFSLTMTDKSLVRAMTVNCTSATISMKKNAEASLTVTALAELNAATENNARLKLTGSSKDLNLTASGSSEMTVNCDSGTLTANTEGSSNTTVTAHTGKVYVSSSGSSKISLTGSASTLAARGARSCSIDALNLPVTDAEVTMTSGTLTLSPSKSLFVDLSGGSAVYYNGSPEIKVAQILKSTLAPYGTK